MERMRNERTNSIFNFIPKQVECINDFQLNREEDVTRIYYIGLILRSKL